MRTFSALLIVVFGLAAKGSAQTGTCPAGTSTIVTGTVYAPDGTDPLPNVTVYIPQLSAPVPLPPLPQGVSCPLVGAAPAEASQVGTTTNVNGNFELDNVPVGSGIPIVAISGKWRVQSTVDTTACATSTISMNMPQNQSQGDIPLIAVATGSADQVECVLLKMGISQSEFTDMGGGGRINLFGGGGATGAGVTLDAATPTQASLMSNSSTLNQYDVLMLPCEGGDYTKPDAELQNLVAFANDGGRVYSSHYSYSWMWQNPPFNDVANWNVNLGDPPDGTATVDNSFTAGQTLSAWLQNNGVTTTPGQMAISTLRVDTNGVVPPTQSWLTLNDTTPPYNNPVMQFVFDTPVPSAVNPAPNQCGRVLYNEYHVENSSVRAGTIFPNECDLSAAMTPQEKLLEYMLFELTSEGGQPSLAPASVDFGPEAVGVPSPAQSFTWTNNSSFVSKVSSVSIAGNDSGDFSIASPNCGPVLGGSSCTITVVFTPTALGMRAATLTVVSGGNSLTAPLTGTGTPGFTLSPASLSFGSLDVGAAAAQTLNLTSVASVPLTLPPFVTTGEYSLSTAACANPLPALASCPVTVTFLPTTTGPQGGTVGVTSTSLLYSGLSASLSGNGIDFTILLNPAAGTVVAGDGTTTTATLTPLAGFIAPLALSCATAGVAASTCTLSPATVVPSAAVTSAIGIGTTSQYTVVGYNGFGGGYLWLVAMGSGWLLWTKRRSRRALLRGGLLVALLAAMGLALTGCTGKLPAENAVWTRPGNYSLTVTATDGFLVHSATYSLTVTEK